MKIKLEQVLIGLLILLFIKSLAIHPLNIAESILGLGLISYVGYMRYLEHKKAKDVEDSFEKRLSNVESKLSVMSMGSRTINQR